MIHINKIKVKERFFKVRFPYQRKFEEKKYSYMMEALQDLHNYRDKYLHSSFIEIYEIIVDENPYYEAYQRLACKVYGDNLTSLKY